MSESPAERLRENLTGVVSTVVTGVWLAAMVTGQDWWLAALLVGYVVVVPLTAILFGDEEDVEEWWDDDHVPGVDAVGDEADEPTAATAPDSPAADEGDRREALDTLRDRYARGELTDEQFERKLERLLETESIEDLEDRVRREREHARGAGRGSERER
ncbi:SHOCT domain-containing protein [Halobaculum sp. EA56]|uniref:SHOCT domain-containing protein n=1 Tax=Halobaculum sp. EA56 TaxID=3421648 RepID=UPI003EBD285B